MVPHPPTLNWIFIVWMLQFIPVQVFDMDLENGENLLLVVIFLLLGPDLVKFILSEITKFSCNLIFLSMDVTFMEMFSGILQQDVPNHDVCLIRTFLFFIQV